MKAELADRLSALQVELAPEVVETHLAAVSAELEKAPTVPERRIRRLRRLAPVLAAALLPVVSAGVAVAAEGSVPGEVLYPVKQATEWVRSLVEVDIAADHRLDELDVLIDRHVGLDAVTDQLRRAEEAVQAHTTDVKLHERLDVARDRIIHDYPTPASQLPAESGTERPTDSIPPAEDHRPITTDPPASTTTSTSRPPDHGGHDGNEPPPTSPDGGGSDQRSEERDSDQG